MNDLEKLRKKEREIMTRSVKIAVMKQDIIKELLEYFEKENYEVFSQKHNKDRLIEILYKVVKGTDNNLFYNLLNLEFKGYYKERDKIKKIILNKIKDEVKTSN